MRHKPPFYLVPNEPALKGATICDVILAPSHRRADHLIRLVRAGSELADADLILHGSNEFSDPIYRKLFRYPIAFSLSAKGFPLRIARPLKRLTGAGSKFLDLLALPWRCIVLGASWLSGAVAGVELQQGGLSDVEYRQVHAAFTAVAGPHFQRDREFVRWRFETGPLYRANILRLVSRGTLIGYVAMRLVEFGGLRLSVIIDVILTRPLVGLERFALAMKMVRRGSRDGADAVVTLANFDNSLLRSAVSFPFVNIPDKYLPHTNPVFALIRDDKQRRLQMLAGTFMTLADIDFF